MAKPPFTKEHPCPGCASTDALGHFGVCPNMGALDYYGNPMPAVPADLRTQTEVRSTSSTGGEKGVKPERHSLIPVEPLNEVDDRYKAPSKTGQDDIMDVSLDDVAEWAKHSIIAIDNASDKYRRGKITLEELQAVIKKSMTGQHD